MEKFVTLLIPALVALVLVRLLLMPMKLIFKVGVHSGCGFLCLWLPGIGVMALLEVLSM